MGLIRAGWGLASLGLCGCSLLVGAPDARYDGGTPDATAQDTAEPDGGADAEAAAKLHVDAAPDAAEAPECDGALCADAAAGCPDEGCAAPDAGRCPFSRNPCVVQRWNRDAESCHTEILGDCTPCGADGLCSDGECYPQGILYFEDFEDDELGAEWTSPAPSPWRFDSSEAHAGTHSLGSGAIGHRERSSVTLSLDDVSPRAMLRFWYRVDSETNFDTFDFQVGDSYEATFSEPRVWDHLDYPLAPGGDLKLTWIYMKDGVNSVGADRAWLDEVTVYLACGDDDTTEAQ